MKPSLIRVMVFVGLGLSIATAALMRENFRPLRFARNTIPTVIVVVGLNGLALYYFSRRQRRIAEDVLAAIRHGNLKARFPSRKLDEVGQLYKHFNSMADEIDRLVTRLRQAETARTQFLRELSHDVRSPLTSIQLIVEIFHDRSVDMKAEEIHDNSAIVLAEINYFQRLIEDLFLIAQIDEPNYRRESEEVPIFSLAKEECEIARAKFSQIAFTVQEGTQRVFGDSQMLRRLVRNLIENAGGYAKSKVSIFEIPSGFAVRDDGPGFSEDAAAEFGRRKKTRLLEMGPSQRATLGLGSVIVKSVVEAHGGTLAAGNWLKPDGTRGGGEVTVKFLQIERLSA